MFTLEYAFTYGSGKSNFEEKISTTVNQKKKKRKSKVHQRIMSWEYDSNFDQWKALAENYELVRTWSWFVHKTIKNNCRSRLSFS